MAADETSALAITRLQEASVTKRTLRMPPVWAALSRKTALVLAAQVTKLGKRVAERSAEPARRT